MLALFIEKREDYESTEALTLRAPVDGPISVLKGMSSQIRHLRCGVRVFWLYVRFVNLLLLVLPCTGIIPKPKKQM